MGDVRHYVVGQTAAADVAEAYVTGSELTAVCGSTFVPSRDPNGLPECDGCRTGLIAAYDKILDEILDDND